MCGAVTDYGMDYLQRLQLEAWQFAVDYAQWIERVAHRVGGARFQDELISYAMQGIPGHAIKYVPYKGATLKTFLMHAIRQDMRNYLRTLRGTMHVSKEMLVGGLKEIAAIKKGTAEKNDAEWIYYVIEQLTWQEQITLYLRAVRGMTVQSVATELNIGVATVHRWYGSAIAHARRIAARMEQY